MPPSGGTGVEVGEWLRGLGLGQYEQGFRDNDVDVRVLPGLTADDLREIGVVSVGHRRLMLPAIAGLAAATVPATPAQTATPTAETEESPSRRVVPEGTARRRRCPSVQHR